MAGADLVRVLHFLDFDLFVHNPKYLVLFWGSPYELYAQTVVLKWRKQL
jgi:hypothetical protein